MRPVGGRPSTRRAIATGVGGLVLTGLVVVLSSYQVTGYVPALGSVQDWIYLGSVSQWQLTPGLQALELVAYLGIAIASIGPFWYLTLRPVVVTVGVIDRLSPASENGSADFDFGAAPATRDRPTQDGSLTPGRQWDFRNFSKVDTEREWVEELFRSNEGIEARTAGKFARPVGGQSKPGVTSTRQDREQDTSPSSPGGPHPTVNDEVDTETADRATVNDGGTPPERSTDEGTGNVSRTSESIARRENADAGSGDPTDRLATELSTAMAKVDRFSANLEDALDTAAIGDADGKVPSMRRATEMPVEAYRDARSGNGRPMEDLVRSLYEEQDRFGSPLEDRLQS